jgi:hypothetical protein
MTLVVVLVEREEVGGCQGATHRVNPVHLNFHHLHLFLVRERTPPCAACVMHMFLCIAD